MDETEHPTTPMTATVATPARKTRITIRLDDDLLRWFRAQAERAGGGSYQALINRALRRHVETVEQPLEETLRRVVREELRRALDEVAARSSGTSPG